MSKGTPRASWVPNLEESHLSGAGLAADNSHFVALPQSHSGVVAVVHLAHSAHTIVQRGAFLE